VIIVKQGEGSIDTKDKNNVMSRLLELGGRAPFFSGHRGSYILLGYRLQRGDVIPWINQVAKVEAGGPSHLRRTIQLECNNIWFFKSPSCDIMCYFENFPTYCRMSSIFFHLRQIPLVINTITNVIVSNKLFVKLILATLQNLLKSANVTFNGALPQWSEIKRLFPMLKKSVAELTQQASAGIILSFFFTLFIYIVTNS
jgi:hypothetical protein